MLEGKKFIAGMSQTIEITRTKQKTKKTRIQNLIRIREQEA